MINLKNIEQAAAVYALIAASVFAFLSFYGTDGETYLFPRIIAVVLALMSVSLLIANWSSKNDNRSDSGYFAEIWPGMVVGLVFLLVMEDLGFYVSSFFCIPGHFAALRRAPNHGHQGFDHEVERGPGIHGHLVFSVLERVKRQNPDRNSFLIHGFAVSKG